VTTEPRGVIKRSIAIAGHRTSISLEEPFWEELRRIASARGIALQRLVAEVDAGRAGENLSSALRVHVLEDLRAAREATPGPVDDV
jgi:predicted DNA-binding ribbon-helix-helix protein